MPTSPKPIVCPRILERHAALGCTEVALCRHELYDDMFVVELITARSDGSYSRDAISGLGVSRRRLAARLMDFHAGVVSAQRAAGMVRDDRFDGAPVASDIPLRKAGNGLIGKRMRRAA